MECHGNVRLPLLNWWNFPISIDRAMVEKVTVTYVTGDGGCLLKPRLVLQLHREEANLSQVAARLCDTCLEILGCEVGRNNIQREDVKFSQILEELHKKDFCKSEDFTALGTLKGVQFVGLGSNLKTRNRAFWLATSAAILLRVPQSKAECVFNNFGPEVRVMVQQAAQQRRFFLVQSRIPTREEILTFQLQLTELPRGDTRRWVKHGEAEDQEVWCFVSKHPVDFPSTKVMARWEPPTS